MPSYHWLQPIRLWYVLCRHPDLISIQAKPGMLIYDPFCGTGSFLYACSHFGAFTCGHYPIMLKNLLTSLGSDIGLKVTDVKANSRWPQHARERSKVLAVKLYSVQSEHLLFGCFDLRSDSKSNPERRHLWCDRLRPYLPRFEHTDISSVRSTGWSKETREQKEYERTHNSKRWFGGSYVFVPLIFHWPLQACWLHLSHGSLWAIGCSKWLDGVCGATSTVRGPLGVLAPANSRYKSWATNSSPCKPNAHF